MKHFMVLNCGGIFTDKAADGGKVFIDFVDKVHAAQIAYHYLNVDQICSHVTSRGQCYDSHLQVAEGYFDALVHACKCTEPSLYPKQEPTVIQTLLYLAFYKVGVYPPLHLVVLLRCPRPNMGKQPHQLADGKTEVRRKAVELIKWLSEAVEKALRLKLQSDQVQPYYNMAIASSLQRDVGYASWQVPVVSTPLPATGTWIAHFLRLLL
jgi:hypothetical protein